MKLTADQIDYAAFQVIKRLEAGEVLTVEDTEAAHRLVVRLVTDDLQVEDKLNDEVRQLLDQYEGYMRKEGVQHHELFKKVKAKLVNERKLIL